MHVKLDRTCCRLRRTATKMLTGRRRVAIYDQGLIYDQSQTAIMLTSKWSVSVQSCCCLVNQNRWVPLLQSVPEGSMGHLGIVPYLGIGCCPVLGQETQPAINRGDVRHLSIVDVPSSKRPGAGQGRESILHLLVLRHSVALLLAAVFLLAASACPWPAFVISHILLDSLFPLHTNDFRSQTWSSCDTTASVTVKPRLSS